MDDDDILYRLVEMLSAFFTEGIALEEDLTYSLTGEFLRNIQDVLYTTQLVVFSRWEKFFDMCNEMMISSTEMYLRYVFYACQEIKRADLNRFEKFLAAFALILRSSIETCYRNSMNFCKLVPDAFMVFYENALKKKFCKRDGVRQFFKYINNPKNLESKCIVRNISDSYNPNASVSEISNDLRQKVFRMISEEKEYVSVRFDFSSVEKDTFCSKMAKKVLQLTESELLPKLIDNYLNSSVSPLYPQKNTKIGKKPTFAEAIEKVIDLELTSEHSSSFKSDSKTNDDPVVEMADNTQYEKIIEAVIRHNHSKSSCHVKSKGRIQTEADQNLERMKNKIQSLIEVLDE